MRILAITNLYPRPGHETLAPFNRRQFAALAQHHELAIVAPILWTEGLRDRWAGRKPPPRDRNSDGILVDYPWYYYTPKMFEHHYGAFFLASVRGAVERMRTELDPDVVLASYAHPDGWAAARLARRAGLPLVIKAHGTDILRNARNPRRCRRLVEGLTQADAVVAVSHHLADTIANLGIDRRRVHVVYNGLDRSLFRPGSQVEARARLNLTPASPLLLFVGNLLFSKGAGLLIEACARLAAERLDFTCHLVGRGRDESRLRTLVARHYLNDRVLFAGPRPYTELPDWYRASDLVVLPSYSEGIPNVLREAAACGRPFVATRVGGIPEMADSAGSVLIEPGSVNELVQALNRALTGGLSAPGTQGSASASEPIDWNESARQLAGVLQQVTRSTGHPQVPRLTVVDPCV